MTFTTRNAEFRLGLIYIYIHRADSRWKDGKRGKVLYRSGIGVFSLRKNVSRENRRTFGWRRKSARTCKSEARRGETRVGRASPAGIYRKDNICRGVSRTEVAYF